MILFFTKGDRQTGSSRQRVWNVAEKLQESYGVTYDIVHSIGYSVFSVHPKRVRVWAGVLRKLISGRYGVFFVHKSIFPLDIVLLIILVSRLWRIPMVYDLDDAEWVHSKLKTKLLAKNAHVVFCGSHYIKGKIEEWTKKTALIPTVIDFGVYKKYAREHKEKDVLNIAWVGYGPGYVRNGHMDILKKVLKHLKEEGFGFNFVFMGARGSGVVHEYFSDILENMRIVDALEWDRTGAVPEALKAYEIDVGVAPISENSFSKAKCAFKIIEYMAVGLPVVVSPVGEQEVVVRNGIDGFHARTVGEWVDALKKLADEKKRAMIGASGIERVSEHYTYDRVIPVIAKILYVAKT